MMLGQLVIERSTGDIGTVVEFDDTGRTHRVRYRNGSQCWHYKSELAAI